MPPRLIDVYRPGDFVEVYFDRVEAPEWRLGTVVAHDPPAVWVRTEDGELWYVTNTRRIRPAPTG